MDKVRVSLAGQNGNAFHLLGVFRRAAVKQGWSDEEIRTVFDEAKSKDYDHLIRTLLAHCEEPSDDAEAGCRNPSW
ncbi:hypothetical protein GobsT_25470 [Gemmata obscuriglobus]|uniref:Uncharacterized protein n=1 Tax=Gemmata obscuriglobus TaxID=114 RepID=A0A2Z3GXG1_9BACT|nr:hypothetical protein [Gemmata obscuriglobus]AWM39169.1 hypothetical protein C1280_20720 [Gemmata obscuriglobus]QEG27783.1 hypothetical protein GobsT_25470 [Gemmata obscuriglobus]VTS05092.1 Putative uncharacterized protein OS=Acinetobacter phage Acj61 GN=Acj61p039 PE=4 SV=1 [Gemmata obscuriglobus UQM 2246]